MTVIFFDRLCGKVGYHERVDAYACEIPDKKSDPSSVGSTLLIFCL